MDVARDLLSLPVRQALEKVRTEAYQAGFKDGYEVAAQDEERRNAMPS